MDLTSTKSLDLAATADIIAGSLAGAKAVLYKTDVLPTFLSVIGDFTLADYVGAVPLAVTWLAPSVSDDGHVEVVGTIPEFRPTNSVTPNTVFGVLLTNGAGTSLLIGGRFDNAPLPMNSNLDAIVLTVRVREDITGFGVTVS